MRTLLAFGISLGWFALMAQLYLILWNRTTSIAETIIRYFSFFTILTNILVALCFTFLLFKPASKWGIYFKRPSVATAITVYITIVGVVYNIVLRPLWNPQGLQLVVDELLHSVIPVLVLAYWFAFVPKGKLGWKQFLPWLLYPLIYLVYVLIRGSLWGSYPYPFINVESLGYEEVFINCGVVCLAFMFFSFLLIGLSRIMSKTSLK